MENQINNIFKDAKIDDSADVWTKVREYILSRLTNRYNTVDELKQDANDKFKEVMVQIQDNYDRWFERELLKNTNMYGIEILGGEDIVNEEDFDEGDYIDEGEENPNDRIENVFDDEDEENPENQNIEKPKI